MAFHVYHYLKDYFLAALSSLLLILSFPRFDFGILAWVALLPLLTAMIGKSIRHSFFLSLICGILFFLGIFHWILVVPNYTLLHHALLAVYLGLYFGLFGVTFNLVFKHWGATPTLFGAPFLWVSFEYIRSNLSFLALPWGLLAHSQYQYPSVIQIASITGAYGISFLIVMVNAALAGILFPTFRITAIHPPPSSFIKSRAPFHLRFLRRGQEGLEHNILLKGRIILILITALLTGSTFAYGHFIISKPIVGDKIRVSLVQGNIEQEKKWDPRFAREILQIYAELTQEASRTRPSLIVWPETSTPGSISLDPKLYTEIKEIVRKAGESLLVGSAQHRKFEEKDSIGFKYSNSAYLIHPGSIKNQQYDKIRLFPFGEYLPYKEIIPWSLIGVSNSDNFSPGKEFTIFTLNPFRFGVTICWENVFPNLFRQFVKNGAQFMINITNEARFGKTAAPYQLASFSIFRAVENRVFVIRCANTGVSCIIDPYGRILDRVKDNGDQDIFVRGIMNGYIIPLKSKTLYTRYGDFLGWAALMGSALFLLIALWKRKQ
jgi:apolipoprotein N-acyltransferase